MGLRRAKRTRGKLDPDLAALLRAVADGSGALDAALRRQLEYPGFVLWVDRELSTEWLRLTVVYDGNLEPKVRVGNGADLTLDDIEVRIAGIDDWVLTRSSICHGILAVVDLVGSWKWPKRIALLEWRYRVGGPLVERAIVDSPRVAGTAPSWLAELVGGDDGVVAGGGAAAEAVGSLPADLADFQRWSDGATLWGTLVLPVAQLDHLDIGGRQFLAISPDGTGGIVAIALDDPGEPVVDLDLETGDTYDLAPSFRDWVRSVRDRAITND